MHMKVNKMQFPPSLKINFSIEIKLIKRLTKKELFPNRFSRNNYPIIMKTNKLLKWKYQHFLMIWRIKKLNT